MIKEIRASPIINEAYIIWKIIDRYSSGSVSVNVINRKKKIIIRAQKSKKRAELRRNFPTIDNLLMVEG